MAKSRVTPKDVVKIRRLPTKGSTIRIEAEVTRVAEPEGGHQGYVTLRIPGAPAPVTIPASFLPADEAADS